jgi:hypothetical protein
MMQSPAAIGDRQQITRIVGYDQQTPMGLEFS